MNLEKTGKFICELRKEQNLSQYQLADLIPISRQGVSKWERGKTTPDPQTLLRLSEIFHVTINELLVGERLLNNSIEELEETTLSILDQSNKKTKTIKRITTISISIIIILLLSFLSYYFINSYNSIEVYTIGGKSKNFTASSGLFLTTREKYYLKLGKIKAKNSEEIKGIKLYYQFGNKKKVIAEDSDIDNITIEEYYGYSEKISKNEISKLKDNLYLEITNGNDEIDKIKIRFIRDYNNNSLFFLNQKQQEIKPTIKETTNVENIKQVEEKKEEETKPTIQETTPSNLQESDDKNDEKPTEPSKQEETNQEEQQSEEPQETVITTEMVINKIKEVCPNTNGTYICKYEDSNTMIMYYSIMNKITMHKNGALVGNYFININNYVCAVENCETVFNEVYKEYLFS